MSSKYEAWEQEPFAACEDPDHPVGKWLLERLPVKPTRVLDVGCGTGVHTKWFNDDLGIHCEGITINRDEISRRVHPRVGFGDMCQIPFVGNGFDLVFALGSLEHTFSPFIALCEFNRVLKTGGYLYFDMPSVGGMEIIDPEYWYHKSVLFPIQVRDLLLKSQFDLIHGRYTETIEGTLVSAHTQAQYIAKKSDRKIRWI